MTEPRLLVLAIAHDRRRPGYWRGRMGRGVGPGRSGKAAPLHEATRAAGGSLPAPRVEARPMTPDSSPAAEYARLRAVLTPINSELCARLPREALEWAGQRLGLLHRGTLIFGSEDDASVLMDFCAHAWRVGGLNVTQRLLAEAPGEPGSDRRLLLGALAVARYRILVVQRIVEGFGVVTFDALDRTEVTVADLGLASSAVPHAVVAGRILHLPGFAIQSGIAQHVTRSALVELRRRLAKTTELDALPQTSRDDLLAEVTTRCILEVRAREEADPFLGAGPQAALGPPPPAHRLSRRPSRNGPCPCGSGRRYKGCCGRDAG